MFGKLEATDIALVEAYMANHNKQTIYLAYPVEQFKQGALQGDLFGYLHEGTLVGLFYFSHKKSLMLHFSDPVCLKSIQLLKAFRYYNPKYLKGSTPCMNQFYEIICRIVKSVKEDQSYLMSYDPDNSEAPHSLDEAPDLFSQLPEPYDMINIVTHDNQHLFKDLKFFMRVEQHFGVNVTAVHDIQRQLKERLSQQQYCLIHDGKTFIAQGFIEEETETMGIIGGVYVAEAHRGKGLAAYITKQLTMLLIGKGKSPYLFVLQKNKTAIAVYEKIGYKICEHFSILTIEE